MNTGIFGEGFPYSNFHDLNMDWIIKIAKDFLDQYTHIQEIIANGEQSIQDLTTSGLEQLQDKADNLEQLLQDWYNTHSEDIANELANALEDIGDTLTSALQSITNHTSAKITEFNNSADVKADALLDSIPDDYTQLSDKVLSIENYSILNNSIIVEEVEPYKILTDSTGVVADTTFLFYTSGYIPVVAGATYKCVHAARICFYNADKEYIGTHTRDVTTINVPSNAYYMRFSWYNDHADNKTQYLVPSTDYPVIIDIEDILVKLNSIIAGYPNSTIDISKVQAYKILNDSTGEVGDTTFKFYTTDFIPVVGDTDYLCSIASRICFYGINKQYIGTHTRDVTTIHTHGDAYYVRFSWYYIDCPLYAQFLSTSDAHEEFNLHDIRQRYDIYHTNDIFDFYKQMEYCYTKGNMDVYIHEGTYTFTNHLIEYIRQQNKRGIRIGNNNRYYFDTNTSVICIYSGTSYHDIATFFSAFDSDNTGGNYELNNLLLLAKNILYGVHDESNASDIPTTRIYRNCYLTLDNTDAQETSFNHVIGGGFGDNCLIIHENCIYESTSNNRDVSYHGNNNGDHSRLIMTGCYLAHTFAFDTPLGSNRKELTLSNNSLGSALQITQTESLIVHEWNNIIRQ